MDEEEKEEGEGGFAGEEWMEAIEKLTFDPVAVQNACVVRGKRQKATKIVVDDAHVHALSNLFA